MIVNETGIVSDGMVFCVDAGNEDCYSGSGTTLKDIQGQVDGSLISGTAYNSADGGKFTFDSVDDRIDFDYNPRLNFQYDDAFTIDCWVKVSAVDSWIVTNRVSDFSGWGLFVRSSREIIFIVGGFPSSTFSWRRAETDTIVFNSTVKDEWAHIVSTNTGVAGEQKVYINGVDSTNVSSDDSNPPYTIPYNSNYTVSFGWAGNSNNPGYLDGELSNCRIYSRSLSSSEVQQNYNALRHRFE